MAVKEILLLGNPILRNKSSRVEDLKISDAHQTVNDLRDTLNNFRKQNGFGRGISAPQIGITSRIIFIDVGKPIALINPEIIESSTEMMILWDDCFSFPDIMVKVKRSKEIKVHYIDPDQSEQIISANGSLSELLQHEIDHLDGILAIDRAIDSKHIILKSEYKKYHLIRNESPHPL
ncbi:MAG: peptide deformylase [Ignavibacteriales bacterium]|nr:peptide deformylase [Ignavibacteriales bacterium]